MWPGTHSPALGLVLGQTAGLKLCRKPLGGAERNVRMYEGSPRREKTSRLKKRRGIFRRKLRAQKDSSAFKRS